MTTIRTNYWCFTINNPAREDLTELGQLADKNASYLVWQLEEGEEGTQHIQGYVELEKRMRLTGVKKLLKRAHFERRRGTSKQASDYCKKEDTRIDGPFEFGHLSVPEQGKRNDLLALKEDIDNGKPLIDLWNDNFNTMVKYYKIVPIYLSTKIAPRQFKTCVHVHWGESRTGKSKWFAWKLNNGYRPQFGAQTVWYPNYNGTDPIIFDEFHGNMKFDEFKNLTDAYDHWVETKGGHIRIAPRTICFTSNKDPREWYSAQVLGQHGETALLSRINVNLEFWKQDDIVYPGDTETIERKNNCICGLGTPTNQDLNLIKNNQV